MKKILMASDLSSRSNNALQRAFGLATQFGAELEVIHVVDESLIEPITIEHESLARSAIEEQIKSLVITAASPRVSFRVIRGIDFCDISSHAQETGADLLVLGTTRYTVRRLFQGTTAERVIRHARVPVLVVKRAVVGPYRRGVVAVDVSPHAHAAFSMAARLLMGGEVHLVHAACRPSYALLRSSFQRELISGERTRVRSIMEGWLAESGRAIGQDAPKVHLVLEEGEVCDLIRAQVSAIRPDLLALGTHGRAGMANAILGSVAEELLANAPVDVLVVKAQ